MSEILHLNLRYLIPCQQKCKILLSLLGTTRGLQEGNSGKHGDGKESGKPTSMLQFHAMASDRW